MAETKTVQKVSFDLLHDHPSVKHIADSISAERSFSFKEVGPDVVHHTICKLNQDKTVTGPFSIKVVRMVADIVSDPVSKLVNTTNVNNSSKFKTCKGYSCFQKSSFGKLPV